MSDAGNWLAGEWAEKLGPALSAMTGTASQAVLNVGPGHPQKTGDQFWWRQPLDIVPEAAIWISCSGELWHEIGKQVLHAAGMDDADEEDIRGTFLEVLQQSLSQLTTPLSSRLGREVSLVGGEAAAGLPEGFKWQVVQVLAGGEAIGNAWLTATQDLLELLTPREERPQESREQPEVSHKGSRTLDLLMEVELPIGVSFGRAQMRLKDAIKLTTGSIVELNRSVTEPVEIVVNNCVIARGEVVVVEGNYGVRIQQIISREERLRTLF